MSSSLNAIHPHERNGLSCTFMLSTSLKILNLFTSPMMWMFCCGHNVSSITLFEVIFTMYEPDLRFEKYASPL